MKTVLQKRNGGLMPCDELGQAALDKYKDGDEIMVEVRKPRHGKQHRLFFALLHLVMQNQDRYPSIDVLLAALKVAQGYATAIPMKNGNTAYLPKSINFSSMDQDKFDEFFNRSLDIIIKDIIPGMDKTDLLNEIKEICGIGGIK